MTQTAQTPTTAWPGLFAESDEELAQVLFAPALLADVSTPILVGERRLGRLPAGSSEWAKTRQRLDELAVRVDPQGVLNRLDRQPGQPEESQQSRLRATALLELGRTAEAAELLAQHASAQGPSWLLLRARLAAAQGDRRTALLLCDRALPAAELDAEVFAEGLSLRLRYRALTGDRAGAAADAQTLRRLCQTHRAVLSERLIEVMGSYVALPETRRQDVAQRAFRLALERTMAELCAELPETQESLGPLPLVVHGLFVKLRHQPPRLIDLAVGIAGALVVCGDPQQAYAILYYAAQIAARRLTEAAAPLHQALVELQTILGREQSESYQSELATRSATFLAQKGRVHGPVSAH